MDQDTSDNLDLKQHIRGIPDFPKPGILFYDISTLLRNGLAFRTAIHRLGRAIQPYAPTMLAGIESRGFLLAAPLAMELGLGFVMLRKRGKLPGETVGLDYALEYGTDRIEIQADAVRPGDRVVVQIGNVAEFFSVVFGLFRAGMIPVYALPAHRITEIAHFARRAEARGYVTMERADGFDYRTLARALRAEVPAVGHVVIIGAAEEFTALEDCVAEPRDVVGGLPADPDPSSVAFLQISGGSTGLSKLIPRTAGWSA